MVKVMHHRRLLALAALLAVMLVGVACGSSEDPTATPRPAATAAPTEAAMMEAEAKYGGVFTVAHRGDPRRYDSHNYGSLNWTTLVGAIYHHGFLTRPCRVDAFTLCPNLAESWDSNADFTVWTFHIRDNIVWHDGKKATADDIGWALNLAWKGFGDRAPSQTSARLGPIDTVDVMGNDVVIKLSKPVFVYPDVMSQSELELEHPRHLMESELQAGNFNVSTIDVDFVGTGPFKVAKYEKDSSWKMVKHDQYWEKDDKGRQLPFLNGIDHIIMSEQSAQIAAFRAGSIDRTGIGSTNYMTIDQIKLLQDEMGDKVQFHRWPPFGKLMGVNARIAPYNDVRVRKAISLWFDRREAVCIIDECDGEITAVWANGSPFQNPDFLTWPGYNENTREADRAEAKRLLAEAGFPDGFKMTIMAGENWVRYAEWAQDDLKPLIGENNISIDVVDNATYGDRRCAGDFETLNPLSSGVVPRHSPELLAGGYLSTNKCSYIQHDDTNVDDMFAAISASTDSAERIKLARELERYLTLDTALAWNIYLEYRLVAFRDYVKGFIAPTWAPPNNSDYATTWLDK
jgi:peptide/nickel transport system substrate-binding protein